MAMPLMLRSFEPLKNRRGAALAFTAVVMIALLAAMGVAIDLGMARAAKAEAQRVADASALAGASVFLDATDLTAAAGDAKQRAKEFAAQNQVRNKLVDTVTVSTTALQDESSEMIVQVIPDEAKVRVWIMRAGLPTWFARFIGINTIGVRAMAAATAAEEGSSIQGQCLLPFAIADLWDDQDDDENFDDIPNNNENWEFDPEEADGYAPYDPEGSGAYYDGDHTGTGLGSDFRNPQLDGHTNDYGRRFWVKAGPPGQEGKGGGGDAGGLDDMTAPGNFYLFDIPDPAYNDCDPVTAPEGMEFVEQNILTCSECEVSIGVEYKTEPGNKAALADEMDSLFATDPAAEWDDTCNCIINSKHGDHDDAVDASGRVRVVALWDPSQGGDLRGRDALTFNNFAKVFVEAGGTDPPDFQIFARFLGPVEGSGEAPPGEGTLIRQLRLVE